MERTVIRLRTDGEPTWKRPANDRALGWGCGTRGRGGVWGFQRAVWRACSVDGQESPSHNTVAVRGGALGGARKVVFPRVGWVDFVYEGVRECGARRASKAG